MMKRRLGLENLDGQPVHRVDDRLGWACWSSEMLKLWHLYCSQFQVPEKEMVSGTKNHNRLSMYLGPYTSVFGYLGLPRGSRYLAIQDLMLKGHVY